MFDISLNRQRFFAPEVIQTSEMDCGPAALKCLLDGHGIPVSYGRLREACQTDVDGTSIDTLEEIAGQLGLDAQQVMIPVDHMLLPESESFPAIVVVRHANGATHFVIVWQRHGTWLQVMDPAIGRRWVNGREFLDDVYVHKMSVPAKDWYEWATTDEFRLPLARRLKQLGVSDGLRLIADTLATSDPRRLMRLDAAVRLVQSLIHSGGIKRGRNARTLLNALVEASSDDENSTLIPETFWSARREDVPAADSGDDSTLRLRGAVLVRVKGTKSTADRSASLAALNPELAAAMTEKQNRPIRYLLGKIREAGLGSLVLLAIGLLVASAGVVFEAVLFRGIMEIASELRLTSQRLEAAGYFFVLAIAMLAVEWQIAGRLLQLGRQLEIGLRVDFLRKIPLLTDRYFQSRPLSDMAQRSHNIHHLRTLPPLAAQLVQTTLTLALTTAALCWLFPHGKSIAILAAAAAIIIPCIFRRTLLERDLRLRTHAGALSRFYLDALVGLVPIRAHSAQRVVRREHESLLVEWARANLRFIRSQIVLETLVAMVGYSMAGWIVFVHFRTGANSAGSLLLAYWSLQLPILGQQLVKSFAEMPFHRNLVLRAIEPLGAAEENEPRLSLTPTRRASEVEYVTSSLARRVGVDVPIRTGSCIESPPPFTARPAAARKNGVAITLDSVTIRAAGHVILNDVDLRIEPGSHVAIVGPSGAGKSSLVGLLLGWHRPAAGSILIDGESLDRQRLEQLRDETAWVDPAVQLWNRSLFDNLLFGSDHEYQDIPLDEILATSGLYDLLPRLEDGLQTRLGGSGGLLSGGEGQRVRFGRALCRRHARLVILDEPFRGLDRDRRHKLLDDARRWWPDATLLCVTHDVAETLRFPRVIVVDRARIAEDGCPRWLVDQANSRYRALLDAEKNSHDQLWSRDSWRRLRLERGKLIEEHAQ